MDISKHKKKISEYQKNQSSINKEVFRGFHLRIGLAVMRDGYIREIGAQAFVVYLAIKEHANQDNTAFPSIRNLAFQSACSRGTVNTALKILEEKKWIERIGRVDNGIGRFGNNIYRTLRNDLVRGSKDENFLDVPIPKIDHGK